MTFTLSLLAALLTCLLTCLLAYVRGVRHGWELGVLAGYCATRHPRDQHPYTRQARELLDELESDMLLEELERQTRHEHGILKLPML